MCSQDVGRGNYTWDKKLQFATERRCAASSKDNSLVKHFYEDLGLRLLIRKSSF